MNTYKVLNNQIFTSDRYSLVPIRFKDRYDIMKWRNDQIYHLRQAETLTKECQDAYFEDVVSKLFNKEQPNQILFSFLEDSFCIGYGGLVHINWKDKNAEISFLLDSIIEVDIQIYHWKIFLKLIEKVAFNELGLHKIFTYAFDVRPWLYPIFEDLGFEREATLKEHYLYQNSWKSVVIHSKFNSYV